MEACRIGRRRVVVEACRIGRRRVVVEACSAASSASDASRDRCSKCDPDRLWRLAIHVVGRCAVLGVYR